MNIRQALIAAFTLATLFTQTHAANFTLQGSSENDYKPALDAAAQQLASLLNLTPSELPALTIVANRNSSESDAYQGQADLVLADDLLAKKQRGDETMASVIAHEVCHLWLIELAKSHGLAQTKQGYLPSYGHSQFNDWFDEMAAVRCEQGDLAERRLATDFTFIPLATYLTQIHPVYERMQAQITAAVAAQKAKKQNGEAQQTVLKMTVEDDNFADFYQQSAYFAAFLSTLDTQLELGDWFALAQQADPERVAKQLNFENLAEMEQAFYQYIPW